MHVFVCELYMCVSWLVFVSVCICVFKLGVYVCVSVFVSWCVFLFIFRSATVHICLYLRVYYVCVKV